MRTGVEEGINRGGWEEGGREEGQRKEGGWRREGGREEGEGGGAEPGGLRDLTALGAGVARVAVYEGAGVGAGARAVGEDKEAGLGAPGPRTRALTHLQRQWRNWAKGRGHWAAQRPETEAAGPCGGHETPGGRQME